MWSKTRQVLEGRLAENLKGRVRFQYDVYRISQSHNNLLRFPLVYLTCPHIIMVSFPRTRLHPQKRKGLLRQRFPGFGIGIS